MSFDYSDPDFQYLAVDRKKLMKEQTTPFDGKKNCWVPDPKEGFASAEIQSSKGEEITVKIMSDNSVSVVYKKKHGQCNIDLFLFRKKKFIIKQGSIAYIDTL